jgi:hypothetical protein
MLAAWTLEVAAVAIASGQVAPEAMPAFRGTVSQVRQQAAAAGPRARSG